MLYKLYHFNHKLTNWNIKPIAPVSRKKEDHVTGDQIHKWGGGRTHRLLQAAYTIALICLLRFDEVLKIKAEDIEQISPTHMKLTLPFCKTSQFGGVQSDFFEMLKYQAGFRNQAVRPLGLA